MKLNSITIIILGVAVAVIALSFGYFMHWQPNMAEVEYNKEIAQAYRTEIGKSKQAEKKVRDAVDTVNKANDEWQAYVVTNTLPPALERGGIDTSRNAWQLTVDAQRFRNIVQRDVNNQVRSGGVTVITGPNVPDPSMQASSLLSDYFNYPAIPFPCVIYEFGAVTVRGTYEQITANVRSWASMRKYIAIADGLTLTGTSPELTGTYNLTVVGYIQSKEVFPGVPEGANAIPGPGGAPAGTPANAPAGGAAPGGRGQGGGAMSPDAK